MRSDDSTRRLSHPTTMANESQGPARTFCGAATVGSLEGRLVKSAAASFGLKFVVIGFSFFSSLLLARLLGAAEYGVYVYAFAWVNFLSGQTLLGLDRLLVREVAAGQAESAWGVVRGLLRWANQIALGLCVGIGLLAAGIGWALAGYTNSPKLSVFLVALLLLPLLTLTRLRQSATQGLHHVVAGQIPEALVQPALFIVLIVSGYWLLGWGLTAPVAAGMNAAAAATALLVAAILLRQYLPRSSKETPPTYRTRAWISSALPLLLVNAMTVITAQAPILILGTIKGAEAAGIYAVASRVSELIAFAIISVNLSLAPAAARLWAQRDLARLQRLVTRSARLVLVFSLPIGVTLIFFGERVLSLFGQEFTRGRAALVILSIGQIINAVMGSVGVLLVMAGHEREVAIATGICAGLNIILSLVLIPSLGMIGGALAVASSLIIWNILLVRWVHRRLGLHSTALGRV